MKASSPKIVLLVVLTGVLLGAVLLAGTGISAYAAPAILYVASGGSCGSASPCYASVQAAVDAAQIGDEIRVAEGVYSGVNDRGGTPQVVYIDKSLTMRGGFTTSDWSNPDPVTNQTELQAQTLGRVVFIIPGVSVTLEGLYLTYGNADGLGGHSSSDAGGAVYAFQSDLTMLDCWVLHSNTPDGGYGGGVYLQEGTLNMTGCVVEDNKADNGGGVFLDQADGEISASHFNANQVYSMNADEPALLVGNGSLVFEDNLVTANMAEAGTYGAVSVSESTFWAEGNVITGTYGPDSRYGSGISTYLADGTISDNYIADNEDQGVHIYGGHVWLVGNEIAYNTGNGYGNGGGVYYNPAALDTPGRFTMLGNLVHHNKDLYGGCGGGGVLVSSGEASPVLLAHNTIQDNFSCDGSTLSEYGNGGGVYINGDYATLHANIIQRNTATGYSSGLGGIGGGVYITGEAVLTSNVITDNQARFGGSGVAVVGASPELYNNTIANNLYSSGDGSGLYAVEDYEDVPAQPRLYNTIISGQLIGIEAVKADSTSVVIVDGILWFDNDQDTGGGGTVFISNPTGGDPSYLDAANYDYHILEGSLAIDHGTVVALRFDLDDQPRPYQAYDLGADEFWPAGMLTSRFLPLYVK